MAAYHLFQWSLRSPSPYWQALKPVRLISLSPARSRGGWAAAGKRVVDQLGRQDRRAGECPVPGRAAGAGAKRLGAAGRRLAHVRRGAGAWPACTRPRQRSAHRAHQSRRCHLPRSRRRPGRPGRAGPGGRASGRGRPSVRAGRAAGSAGSGNGTRKGEVGDWRAGQRVLSRTKPCRAGCPPGETGAVTPQYGLALRGSAHAFPASRAARSRAGGGGGAPAALCRQRRRRRPRAYSLRCSLPGPGGRPCRAWVPWGCPGCGAGLSGPWGTLCRPRAHVVPTTAACAQAHACGDRPIALGCQRRPVSSELPETPLPQPGRPQCRRCAVADRTIPTARNRHRHRHRRVRANRGWPCSGEVAHLLTRWTPVSPEMCHAPPAAPPARHLLLPAIGSPPRLHRIQTLLVHPRRGPIHAPLCAKHSRTACAAWLPADCQFGTTEGRGGCNTRAGGCTGRLCAAEMRWRGMAPGRGGPAVLQSNGLWAGRAREKLLVPRQRSQAGRCRWSGGRGQGAGRCFKPGRATVRQLSGRHGRPAWIRCKTGCWAHQARSCHPVCPCQTGCPGVTARLAPDQSACAAPQAAARLDRHGRPAPGTAHVRRAASPSQPDHKADARLQEAWREPGPPPRTAPSLARHTPALRRRRLPPDAATRRRGTAELNTARRRRHSGCPRRSPAATVIRVTDRRRGRSLRRRMRLLAAAATAHAHHSLACAPRLLLRRRSHACSRRLAAPLRTKLPLVIHAHALLRWRRVTGRWRRRHARIGGAMHRVACPTVPTLEFDACSRLPCCCGPLLGSSRTALWAGRPRCRQRHAAAGARCRGYEAPRWPPPGP